MTGYNRPLPADCPKCGIGLQRVKPPGRVPDGYYSGDLFMALPCTCVLERTQIE